MCFAGRIMIEQLHGSYGRWQLVRAAMSAGSLRFCGQASGEVTHLAGSRGLRFSGCGLGWVVAQFELRRRKPGTTKDTKLHEGLGLRLFLHAPSCPLWFSVLQIEPLPRVVKHLEAAPWHGSLSAQGQRRARNRRHPMLQSNLHAGPNHPAPIVRISIICGSFRPVVSTGKRATFFTRPGSI